MNNTNTAESRKARSEKLLAKHKVAINPNLPIIKNEQQVRFRTPEEIVKRAVTAFITVQIAIDICNDNGALESVKFFSPILDRFGLREELTPDEKPYFDEAECDNISQEDAYQFQWRDEMCVPLFWACGFRKKLDYPDEMTDTVKLTMLIDQCEDFNELMSKVKMRSPSEILDSADLLLRADWACVEARLKDDPDLAGDLFPDVVVEQHKGINWLIRAVDAEDWDTVAPHT